MNNIKIAVLTQNKKYGEALARGLAEERSGIEMICIDSIETQEYDIILTDFKSLSGPQILVLSDDKTDEANLVDKHLPVGEIMDFIIDRFIEIKGKCFLPQKSNGTVIVGVASETGGAGGTSVAITLGRILSLQEKNVLYLNCSENDDYVLYSECSFESLKSIKELLFRIDEGQKISLQSYTTRDSFGLNMMKPDYKVCSDNVEKLFGFLSEENQYDYIVIDMGRRKEFMECCHHSIVISNCCDSRSKEGGDIYNHSPAERKNSIREDRESFQKKDSNVVISMDGLFATDIKKIAFEKLTL